MMERDHLFISYAWEDSDFADWLTLKLMSEGYQVWRDTKKLLGGESLTPEITSAIKDQSFRIFALISQHSLVKPNPTRERALAVEVGKELAIGDFLIPLNIDGRKPIDLDWRIIDTAFIPFQESWSDGFAAVLRKLESVEAPKSLTEGKQSVCDWFSTLERPDTREERVWTNLLPLLEIPKSIYRFKLSPTTDTRSLSRTWAFRKQNPETVWAFAPPSQQVEGAVEGIGNVHWENIDEYEGIRPRDVVKYLIRREVVLHCIKKGLRFVPEKGGLAYFPHGLLPKDKISFKSYTGKKSHVGVTALRKHRSGESFCFHLVPGFRPLIDTPDDRYLQVSISLYLTDTKGNGIPPERIPSRRKTVCRGWWNHQWLSRLLAITAWIADGKEEFILVTNSTGSLRIAGWPFALRSSVGIDECQLDSEGNLPPALPLQDDHSFLDDLNEPADVEYVDEPHDF